jgi:hypothetical protein
VALPANHCRKLWLLKQIGANISDSWTIVNFLSTVN